MGLEIERKYLNVDHVAIRARLRGLCAVSMGIHFESNLVFDREGQLMAADKALRLRLKEWPDKKLATLTFKIPVENASLPDVKAREELETEIGDYAAMIRILENLGYAVVVRYEKIRETWQLDFGGESGRDIKIRLDLDHLPFGFILEAEGKPGEIDAAAMLLGLDKSKISVKSYYELHKEWLKLNGKPLNPDFVFENSLRGELRQKLGLGIQDPFSETAQGFHNK